MVEKTTDIVLWPTGRGLVTEYCSSYQPLAYGALPPVCERPTIEKII